MKTKIRQFTPPPKKMYCCTCVGRLSEGLDDFNIACRLDPEDASLKIDRDRIEQLVECRRIIKFLCRIKCGNLNYLFISTQGDIIKKNGDELYREKKFDSAEVKYSEALAIDPQFVSYPYINSFFLHISFFFVWFSISLPLFSHQKLVYSPNFSVILSCSMNNYAFLLVI